MVTALIYIFGIIITILLVVGVHEFGHFIVARLCKIKVLRFSIGFGKKLFSWNDKQGTEYVLAAIPLGGYVKMLDEEEGTVPKEELHLAFNRQPVYKRFLVVAAGPIFNFIFAALLYWLLFVIGFNTIKPIIGEVTPNSIAAKAGLRAQEEITKIDDQKTPSWGSVVLKILARTGEQSELRVQAVPRNTESPESYVLNLSDWRMDALKPDPLASLGIIPYSPSIEPVINSIQPDSPALNSGLKVGDKILAINKQPIRDWLDIVTIISKTPGETLQFQISRQHKTMIIPVTVGTKKSLFSKKRGYLGLAPKIESHPELIRKNQYGLFAAIPEALHEVNNFITLNFIVIGKMFTGKISLHSLGGPITIFESAGTALNEGITPFLSFLAFLSISIGFINILPIPGLDGGHVLFQFIEVITRRPLSQRVQIFFYRIGLILLFLLIIQALSNDILRL